MGGAASGLKSGEALEEDDATRREAIAYAVQWAIGVFYDAPSARLFPMISNPWLN
jgi:hypothetical protein